MPAVLACHPIFQKLLKRDELLWVPDIAQCGMTMPMANSIPGHSLNYLSRVDSLKTTNRADKKLNTIPTPVPNASARTGYSCMMPKLW